MIEAMACGTPVIAYPKGAVPEVIEDGISGMLVRNEDEALLVVRNIESIDRAQVRACFERRFTVERMAADYLRVYRTCSARRERSRASRRSNGEMGDRPLAARPLSIAPDVSEPNE